MIRVWVNKIPSDNRTRWECPECGGRDIFFTTPPLNCLDCDTMLPNIELLQKTEKMRVLYHRTFGYLAEKAK